MTHNPDPWQALQKLLDQWQQHSPWNSSDDHQWQTSLQQTVEQWATPLGQVLLPITEFPLINPIAKLPGLGWLAAALGQVDPIAIAQDITDLHHKYPSDTQEELAQHLIQESVLKAGGVGLMTNLLPPIAVTLFAVDIAAIATLQVELLYRIAALYGNDLRSPQCRGEVLTLYLLSFSGSGANELMNSILISGCTLKQSKLFGIRQGLNALA